MSILQDIRNNNKCKRAMLAQLVDPDDVNSIDGLLDLAHRAKRAGLDYFLVGGSLITSPREFDCVKALKEVSHIPIITFPSTPMQLNAAADGVLFLSLISGRNPEYLIGHHVAAAPVLSRMDIEILPTGYMLVDCGTTTTAQYISHSQPLPYYKPAVAAATALAGQMLGLQLLYLDGGSGADRPVSTEMVQAVRGVTTLPLMVGGGIQHVEEAAALYEAGADVIVVGNGAWSNPGLVDQICELKNSRQWKS